MALEHQCFNTILIVIILLFNHAIYHEIILYRTRHHLVSTSKEEILDGDINERKCVSYGVVGEDGERYDEVRLDKDVSSGYGAAPEHLDLIRKIKADYLIWCCEMYGCYLSNPPKCLGTSALNKLLDNKYTINEEVATSYDELIKRVKSKYPLEQEFVMAMERTAKEVQAAVDALKTGPYVPTDEMRLGTDTTSGRPEKMMAGWGTLPEEMHTDLVGVCDESCHLKRQEIRGNKKPDGTTYYDPLYDDLAKQMDEVAKDRPMFVQDVLGNQEPLSDDFLVRCPSGKVVTIYEECHTTGMLADSVQSVTEKQWLQAMCDEFGDKVCSLLVDDDTQPSEVCDLLPVCTAEDCVKPDGTTYYDPMASEWTKRMIEEIIPVCAFGMKPTADGRCHLKVVEKENGELVIQKNCYDGCFY